jgi:hypothetical protein
MIVFNTSTLPKDILILILEFDGRIKYRKGKFINCIHASDYRYALLSTIKIPLPVQYTMENDCTHPEHFEYSVVFNDQYQLSVWNVPYTPPNKIQYLFYKYPNSYIWFRT